MRGGGGKLRKVTYAVLLCAAAAGVALLCLDAGAPNAQPAVGESVPPPVGSAPAAEGGVHLFASVEQADVSALLVRSEDRSFDFLCGDGGVSVNGQRADTEGFFTLLDQILSLPVVPCEPFAPEGEALLTLLLTADGCEQAARFYRTESRGIARVVSDAPGESLYGQVKSWRIGTLLMACDGTRIQDESGNETPVR